MSDKPEFGDMEETQVRWMRAPDGKILCVGFFGEQRIIGIGDTAGEAVSDVFKTKFGVEAVRMEPGFAFALPGNDQIADVEEVLGPDWERLFGGQLS